MIKRYFNNIKKLNTKLLICMITPMIIIMVLSAGTSIRAITGAMTQLSLQQLCTESASSCDHLTSFLSQYLVSLSSKSSSYVLDRYMKTLTFSNNPKTNPYYYQLMDLLDTIYESDSETIDMVWIADFDSGIGIGNTDSEWLKLSTQWQLSRRPWYQEVLRTKSAFISDPHISLHEGTPVIAIVIPIQDDVNERILGVLALDVKLDAVHGILESVTSESSSVTMVLDSNENIISHPDKRYLLHRADQADNKVTWINQDSPDSIYGLFKYVNNGSRYFGYSSPIQGTAWIMVSVIESALIYQNIIPLILQILIIFILSIVLFVTIVSIVSKMITHPLEEITVATKEIAKGNYSRHLISSTKDEVGELASAADTTIQTLRNRAMFDQLTGIYNEFAFSTKAKHLIEDHPEEQCAIIRFDIARFKMINDMFGEAKGDKLLKFIASILHDQVSSADSYGRLNGDVFCICTRESSTDAVLKLIERLTYHVQAFPINFNLTPYFGICLANPETPLSTLLDWSGLALKTVKGSTLTNYAFYNNEMREHLLLESKIENEMADALKTGEFIIHLQPKCDIGSSKVVGAEALVRWIHPDNGMVRPDLFIPLFEKNGFIVKLDEYVWEETCKLIHSWQEKGYPLIPVSVNVSRVHIFDPEFCNKITHLVRKYNIPIEMLELEFTESAFVGSIEQLYHVMETLSDRGFTLSMDDFGSGYSSLNMLKNSPLDIIKIDREFLNETTSSENGRIIIRNTISMLRQLNMKIVAEGVETLEQANFLSDCGCSIAQGYYYSKPISTSAFEDFAEFTKLGGTFYE